MSQPTKGHHPITRAKNVTQHPGLAILEYQQKRRGHKEMSKVRAQECLDLEIAEQRLCTALKMVAKVQDQQQAEDINASVADDSTDTESEKEKTDTNDDKSDPGTPDDDGYRSNEWAEDKSPAPDYSNSELADIEEGLKQVAGQRGKPDKGSKGKKKKGDEIRSLIDTLQKNPHPVGEIPMKLDLMLVTKVPPIPAPKGKKAHAIAAHTVAHPSNKFSSGIIPNWANGVQVAASNTPPLTTTTSSSSVTGFPIKSNSSATGTSNSNPTYYPIQPDGIERDDESDILATLVPNYMAQASGLKNVPSKHKIEHDSTKPGAPPTFKKARKKIPAPLPVGAELHNQFHGIFIPTYKRWVGMQPNPWLIPDDVAVPVLQVIWDTIYTNKVPWTMTAGDCVFECVTQRLYEWRSSFKSAADIMLEQFFNCEDNEEMFEDYEVRHIWAEDMLVKCKFVWAVYEDGKQSGLMRAPFILQVFATHLNSITDAVDVPSLQATNWDIHGEASLAAKYPPKGALALAATAVERTLQLWAEGNMKPPSSEPVRKQSNKPVIKATSNLNPQTGVVSSITSMFSVDNWGVTTRNYLKSIEKMKAGSLETIVQLAVPFMSPLKSHRGESSHSLFGPAQDHKDICACLEDDWHVSI
ncbi:hypothetical protein EI94DRAFT_1814058 [Lactarius quietus]|nr:hypothetical protein EI94DRAFT_1814058 [Lactarius quietus]